MYNVWSNADTGNSAEVGEMTGFQAYTWGIGGVSRSPPDGPVECISLVPLRITEAISDRQGSLGRPFN